MVFNLRIAARILVIAPFLCCLAACSGNGGGGSTADVEVNGDADVISDVQDEDTGQCEPRTCADTSSGCGTHDDGCGGVLDCGTCGCTEESFDTDCPSAPCMQATGCSAEGECQYEPVTCGNRDCESCADGNCSDDEVRICAASGSCPAAFCDPSPVTDEDGQTVYQNQCKSDVVQSCGACGLGVFECVGNISYECAQPSVPDPEAFAGQCDAELRPSFVYLDPNYQGADSDGTAASPFTSLESALEGARSIAARAIVIGGSPELTVAQTDSGRVDAPYHGFQVIEGISMLGGYSGHPDFRRDGSQRPIIYSPAANVALEANRIEEPTQLSGITFENSRDSISDTSYGALLRDSPELILTDVEIIAHDAGSVASGAVADSMPASTTNVTPLDAAPLAPEVEPLFWFFDGSCWEAGFDVPAYVPSTHGLSCPVFDAGARDAYGYSQVPNSSANGGLGGGYRFERYEVLAGSDGVDPLGGDRGGYGGGTLQQNGDPWPNAGGDATPYQGLDLYASAGQSGSSDGTVDADGLWKENGSGTYGEIGLPGPSGGGAAAAETVEAGGGFSSEPTVCLAGPQGGHGGSGGCGGLGGRGGLPGAWAIGILLDGTTPVFDGVDVVVGDAAEGQSGSAGGEPAPGGPGGPARTLTYQERYGDSTVRTSFAGGDGAAGQWGGHGGHGAGGSTVGVACLDATFAASDALRVELGEPGAGATGTAPGTPAGMVSPAPGEDGSKLETFRCD